MRSRQVLCLLIAISTLAGVLSSRSGGRFLLQSCEDADGWHDKRGPTYTCSYWKRWCKSGWSGFEAYPSSDGVTPDQACCACGGSAGTAADVIAQQKAEDHVDSANRCVNLEGWHDKRGPTYTCSYWKRWCKSGWSRFEAYPSSDGVTPDQACCACGGSAGTAADVIAQQKAEDHVDSANRCVNLEGWHDSRGKKYTCRLLEEVVQERVEQV